MWSFGDFRNRKQPICKKGTPKKVKNVNNGGNRVGVILQDSKSLVHGFDESLIEEKKNTSASILLLDSKRRSILETIHEEEDEIEETGSINGDMLLFQKLDVIIACESVHKKMHQGFRHSLMNADTLSSVSRDELLLQTLNSIVDDDVSEASSRGTSDSLANSSAEAARAPPLESLEALSQEAIEDEKNLTSIRNKTVEVDADYIQKMSSANSNNDDNVSIRQEWSNDRMMFLGSSIYRRIWVSTVLLTLLVLLSALIAQRKYFSPASSDDL